MKRFYKFLMPLVAIVAMALPVTASAQVSCDSGSPVTVSNADTSSSTTSYLPAYSLYNYSYSEQIIPAEVLEGLGSINALMYKPTNTTSSNYYDNCEIYLANVDVDDLSSGFVQDMGLFELVYTGSLNWTDAGWQTIVFDDAFAWDGSSNVLIAIRRNHGSWASSSSFAAFSADAQLARYIYQDSGPYTIGSISGGSSTSTVAWYKLIGCEGSGPSCGRVRDVVVSDITSDGCTVSWIDTVNGSATYTIYDMADTTVVATTSSTSYDISGLDINTVYQYAIVADCGGGLTSSMVRFSFRTLAGDPISDFPFTCSFEDDETNLLWVLENGSPNGWYIDTAVNNGGSYGLYISNDNGASNSYTNNTGCVSYAYLTLAMEPGDYTYSFDWMANGESSWDFLRVALAPYGTEFPTNYNSWSSLSVPTGFTTIDGGYFNLQSSWQLKEGVFNIATEGVYNFIIVWRNDGSSGTNPAGAIDNLVINQLTCSAVTDLEATPHSYSVDLTWEPTGDETEWLVSIVDSNWSDIAYDNFYTVENLEPYTYYRFVVRALCDAGDSSFATATGYVRTLPSCPQPTQLTVDSLTTSEIFISWEPGAEESEWELSINDSVIVIYDNPYIIDNLTLNTSYTLSLRALCDNGDTSFVTSVQTRTLAGDPISDFPYICGFEINDDGEDEGLLWVLENSTNGWYVGTAAHNSGDRGLYISNDNGASNSYTTSSASGVSYAYVTFELDEGEYAFSFDWKANGESSWDFLRAAVAPYGTTLSSNYSSWSSTSVPTGFTVIDGGYMNQQTSWQTKTGTFTVDEAGVYNFYLVWRNDGSSGSQPPAAVDNFMLVPLTCPAVTDIVVDNVDETEVTFHWHPVGDESEWLVVMGDYEETVYDTVMTLTDLEPSTSYYVTVTALCDGGDESLPTGANFRTACGVVTNLPWSEDFEGQTSGVAPDCWIAGFAGNPRTNTSSYNAHSGSNYLHFSGSTSTLIVLPEFEESLENLQVRFWTRPEGNYSSCGTFSVGYMTDITDDSSFVAVQTYNYDDFTEYTEVEVPFDTVPDEAVRIAFRHNANSTNYYWYVDDVVVEIIPSCPHPVSVSAVATSASEIDVTVVGGEDDSFRLYWSNGVDVDSADIATDTYTITGLESSTMYTIQAVTICDDGSITSAVQTTAKTQCDGGGCDLTIEMEDDWGDGWNGNAIDGYINGVLEFSATLDNGDAGTYTYSMCSDEIVVLKWQTGSYPDEASFTITAGGEPVASGYGDEYTSGQIIATVTGCPTCSRPSTITVVSTSESEISVTLTGDANGSYRLYWTDGTAVDSADITGLTYSITGLTASTLYTVSAVTVCDDGSLSLDISASCRTQCVGGGCDLTIEMADSFGDGWNGNAIIGYVNGAEAFTATLDNGSAGTFTFSMCNSDNVLLVWTSGSFTSETSFIIENGEEVAVGGGSDYSDGDTIAVVNGCPSCMKPVNLTIDDATTDEIDFHWTPVGNETSWQVLINGNVVATTTTSSYNATGLNSSTTYSIAVRAICGAGDTSNYLTGSAMTLVVPTSVPYSTGFEAGEDVSWIAINGANGWYIGDAASCTGANSLYISDDNGVSNNYSSTTSYSYAYKLFNFTTPGVYAVSFDWRAHGESSYDYLRAFVAPALATFTSDNGISSTGTPAGWVSLDNDYRLNLSDAWNTQAGIINVTGDTSLYVVFYWKNDPSVQNQPPAAVDNIQVAELTCPWPTNATVISVTDNMATVSWTAGGSESEWSVCLDGGTPVVVTDTFYTFTGLQPSSDYTFSVRALCSTTDSSFTTSGSFSTLCGAVSLPWSEDFNSISSISELDCWTRYNGLYDLATGTAANLTETTGGWYTSTIAMDSSTNVRVNIYGTSCKYWLVTPQINLSAPATLSFDVALTDYYDDYGIDTTDDVSDDRFYVLISTDGGNNWSPIATWGNNTTDFDNIYAEIPPFGGENVSINLGSFTGQNALIAFYGESTVSGGDNDLHIDNIMVSAGGVMCNAPQIVTATVTETSASITFSSASDTNEVVIMAGDWVAPANGTEIYTAAYTFTGLMPSTQYTIGVRAVCGEGFYSQWTITTVTTPDHPCDIPTALTVSDNTYDGATVSWTAGAEETEWDVKVFCTSPQYEQVYTVVGTPSLVVTGLDNGVTYYVTVRAMCYTDWYSEWSDTVELTTSTCPQVTGVSANDITATSATVTWTATGAASYEVEYGFAGFQQGTGNSITANTNSVNLTDLEEQTAYDVYVRGLCTEGIISLWSAKYTFTTPAQGGEGIDDVENGNVTLFPNPASTMVTIRGIEGESVVTVVDLNGREVYKANANSSLTIDVTGFAKGAYFVRITGERTTAIRKLVVK